MRKQDQKAIITKAITKYCTNYKEIIIVSFVAKLYSFCDTPKAEVIVDLPGNLIIDPNKTKIRFMILPKDNISSDQYLKIKDFSDYIVRSTNFEHFMEQLKAALDKDN